MHILRALPKYARLDIDDLEDCASSVLVRSLVTLAVAASLKISGGTRLRRYASPNDRRIFAPLPTGNARPGVGVEVS